MPGAVEALVEEIAEAVARKLAEREDFRLMTVDRAAAYLGRTPKALRSLICRRVIPVVREGKSIRLDRRELDKWIKEHASE